MQIQVGQIVHAKHSCSLSIDVDPRKDPFAFSTNVIYLYGGQELRVIDIEDKWLKISTDDQDQAWALLEYFYSQTEWILLQKIKQVSEFMKVATLDAINPIVVDPDYNWSSNYVYTPPTATSPACDYIKIGPTSSAAGAITFYPEDFKKSK